MLLVLNMLGFLSRNIRKFPFLKIRGFFWENIRNFFRAALLGKSIRNFFKKKKFWGRGLKVRRVILRKYKKFFQSGFFREKFWGPRPESALGSYSCKTFHRTCLTVSWICLRFWICQGSEYASSSKYVRVLNMLGFWI